MLAQDLKEKVSKVRWWNFHLGGIDLEEDGGVLLKDFAVRVCCHVRGVSEGVQDDARAVEASGTDALEREQCVVDAAEAVGHDEHDRQGKAGGEVGDGFGFCDRHEPAAGPLHEE